MISTNFAKSLVWKVTPIPGIRIQRSALLMFEPKNIVNTNSGITTQIMSCPIREKTVNGSRCVPYMNASPSPSMKTCLIKTPALLPPSAFHTKEETALYTANTERVHKKSATIQITRSPFKCERNFCMNYNPFTATLN